MILNNLDQISGENVIILPRKAVNSVLNVPQDLIRGKFLGCDDIIDQSIHNFLILSTFKIPHKSIQISQFLIHVLIIMSLLIQELEITIE